MGIIYLPNLNRPTAMMSLAVQVSVRVPVEAYRGGSGLNGSGKKAKTRTTGDLWAGTRAPLL